MSKQDARRKTYQRMKKAELIETLIDRDRRIAELDSSTANDNAPDLGGALEHISDGFILYDADERLVHFNHKILDLYSFTEDDVSGETYAEDLARLDVERGNIVDDSDDPGGYIYKRLTNTRAGDQAMVIQLKNGRWIEARDRHTKDGGIVSIHRDVSDFIRAEHDLMDTQALLTDAIRSFADGFVVYDDEDRLVICNDDFTELYGYTDEQVAPGTHYDDLIRLDMESGTISADQSANDQYFKQRSENRNQVTEAMTFRMADGRWIEVRDLPTSSGGIVSIQKDVTALRQAEEELHKSQEFVRALADNLPQFITIKDLEGRHIFVNKSFEQWNQIKREDAIGKTVYDIYPPEQAADFARNDNRALESREPYSREVDIAYGDGNLRHITSTRFPLINATGELFGLGMMSYDMTELKETQRDLERTLGEFTAVLEAIDYGIMFMDSELRARVSNRAYQEMWDIPADFLADNPTMAEMMNFNRHSGVYDVTDEAFDDFIKDRVTSVMNGAAPPTDLHRADGRIYRHQCFELPNGGRMLTYFDMTKRAHAEAELVAAKDVAAEAEAQLIDAIESISDGFIYYDADERLKLCNQIYRDYYPWIADLLVPGAKLEDIARAAAERGQDAIDIDDIDTWVNNRLTQFREGQRGHEQHLMDSRWLLCSEGRTRDGGLVGIRTDITDHKAAEAALRASEEINRITFENASVGLADVNLEGIYLRINDRYAEILGYAPSELQGQSFRDVTHPDRLHISEENLRQLRVGEVESMVNEKMYVRKDGEIVWAQLWASLVRDADGAPSYYVTVLVDITENKRIEADLVAAKDAAAAAEARMMDAIENVSEGFALFDADDRIILSNTRYREIYGYVEDDVTPGTTLAELIDRDITAGAFADGDATVGAMNRRTATYGHTGETFDVPMADGRWVQIRDRRTSDGGTVSIHADITRRMRGEEELAEKEALLRVALDNMPGGIRLVDENRKLLLFNSQYSELFDFPDDLLQVGDSVLTENIFQAERGEFGEGDPEKLAKSWLASLPSFTELTNWERTTPSGRILDCRTQPIDQGGYVSIITDITERTHAEDALRENQALLKAFLDNAAAPMFVKDVDHRYLLVNKAYAENRGTSPEAMIGKTSHDFFDADQAAAFDTTDKEVMESRERVQTEVRVTQADGAVRDLLVSRFPVLADDGVLIAIGSVSTDITERKKAEKALAEQTELLNLTMENMGQGITMYDADWTLVTYNDRYREQFELPEELFRKGESFDNIVGATMRRDEGENRNDVFKKVRDPRRMTEVWERDMVRENGRAINILSIPVPSGGFVVTTTDITERKQAEEQLTEKEAQLRVILDNVPGGIRYVDRDKRYVFFNKQYSELYEFPDGLLKVGEFNRVENLYQAERGDLGDGNTESLTDDWLAELPVETEPQSWERAIRGGKTLQVNTAPTPAGGVVNIVSDITERKQTEELLKKAKDQAEELSRSKSEFIAVVSHEVRTPMNGVLGMARLLVDTELDTKQREFAETIVRSGESLLAILNDLLDISKLEAGKLEIEAIPLDPHRLVSDAIAVMKVRADEKALQLRQEVADDVAPALRGDSHRLRQIMVNLLSNAIKFTEAGDVTVRMACHHREDSRLDLVITVADTGVGISAEAQTKLFSPYTQGSVEVARKYGGTGLGLAICRRLAVLMEGELTLESTRGKGSCFTLRVPMTLAAIDDIPTFEDPRQVFHGGAATLEPLRVLLVEDNLVNQQVAVAMLEKQGHLIIIAENGEEALVQFRAHPFDIILMDRHMPITGGIEATRSIRAMEGAGKTVPIIGITAAANQAEIADCLEAGMNDVIIKPIDPARLTLAMSGIKAATPLDSEIEDGNEKEEEAAPVEFDASRIEQLRSDYGDDIATKLVDDFRRISREGLESIAAAAKNQEYEDLQREAHSLKSSAMTLGLMVLSNHCRGIENACIDADHEHAANLASGLPDIFNEALSVLDKLD